jgi:hypothetical protein
MLFGRGASLCVCAALAGVLGTSTAHGQPEVAAAAELFQRGLADMMAGRYDVGCPALADSYRLDPRPGTLFTLAECQNKAGKVASAVKGYQDFLKLVAALSPALQEKQKARQVVANEQLAALEPRVPQLTLVLPPDAPAGTVVKRDGLVVEAASLDVAVRLDPGEHVISAQPPGKAAYETRLQLAPSEQKRVVVELGPPSAPPPVPTTPEPSEPADDGSVLRMAGLVTGGVGAAALLVGAITGGLAMSENGTAEENCTGTVCNQEGLDAIDRTRPLGNASTACFVIGGVGVAAGVLMYLLAPSPDSETGTSVGRAPTIRPWFASTMDVGGVAGFEGAW